MIIREEAFRGRDRIAVRICATNLALEPYKCSIKLRKNILNRNKNFKLKTKVNELNCHCITTQRQSYFRLKKLQVITFAIDMLF